MSVTQRFNEGAGEADVCAKPIPPDEILPGNDNCGVVRVSSKGAGKVGLETQPFIPGEDNTPHENLDVSNQRHVQGNQNKPERIEDVFQDDIIKRFMDYSSFRRFALAGNGLKLSQYAVQTIEEDNLHKSVENKKLDLLNKWLERNNGGDADVVKKIKELATTHLGSR